MSLWRQLTRGLRVLTNRDAADRDVADEVQHFLDQSADGVEQIPSSVAEVRPNTDIGCYAFRFH